MKSIMKTKNGNIIVKNYGNNASFSVTSNRSQVKEQAKEHTGIKYLIAAGITVVLIILAITCVHKDSIVFMNLMETLAKVLIMLFQ